MILGKGSIRSRMLLTMMASSLIPLIFIGVFSYFHFSGGIDKLEESKMRDLLDADSREISAQLKLYLRPVQFLADLPINAFDTDDEISVPDQRSLIRYYSGFTSLSIITSTGYPFWIKGATDVYPPRGLNIPQKILDTGEGVMAFFVGDVDTPSAKPMLAVLSRRIDGNYACGILGQKLFSAMLDSLRFSHEGKIFLFDEKNRSLAGNSQGSSSLEQIVSKISRLLAGGKASSFNIVIDLPAPYGQSAVYAQPFYGYGINLSPWKIVALQRHGLLSDASGSFIWYTVLICAFSLGITLYLAWRISIELAVPLLELSDLAHQVALGNLNVSSRPSGWSELNTLSGTFNRMLQRLRKNRDLHSSFRQEIRLRNRFEEKLKKAKSAAEDASKAKSAFLSNVSHEIRTPLNAIMGYAEKLLVENLGKVSEHELNTILSESKNLLLLINDLLDHAKIEAGKLDLDYSAFDLRKLIKDVGESFKVQAADKELDFVVELQKDVPQYVLHDPLRLRQILSNLLTNAIKFTKRGSVFLRVEAFTNDGRYAQTRFSVIDTGIGIPEEKQQEIFEAFNQVDGSYTRRYGGAGLGTSIASRLVNLMGGHMGLQSRSGGGSNFYFDLLLDVNVSQHDIDLLKLSQSSQPQLFKGTFKGHVLVVEDYEVNQELIRSQLEFLGLEIDIAENGQMAVDMSHQRKYDMIFMDLQMPLMDGIEATEHILRECPRNCRTRVVALTANADQSVRAKCRKAGMSEVINKPTRVEELAGALDRWLSNPRTTVPVLAEDAPSENVSDLMEPKEQTLENPLPDSERAAATEDTSQTFAGEPAVDLEEAVRLFAGNKMVLDMSLEQFLNSVERDLLPSLVLAVDNGELSRAARTAHKIKGGAASICAKGLQMVAGELETAARDENKGTCVELLPVLQLRFEQVQEYLKQNK